MATLQEEVIATGKLFELVHTSQPDGRVFEIARRAPGVRLIIADKAGKRVLLTKEFRQELQDWDFRLPGGKVFDSLNEFTAYRESGGSIVEAAAKKAVIEGAEEAAITIHDLTLFKKSTLGATVEWDLYVFEVIDWEKAGSQKLEVGEVIETDNWFGYDEVKGMILRGEMQEERIGLVLLQWITQEEGR